MTVDLEERLRRYGSVLDAAAESHEPLHPHYTAAATDRRSVTLMATAAALVLAILGIAFIATRATDGDRSLPAGVTSEPSPPTSGAVTPQGNSTDELFAISAGDTDFGSWSVAVTNEASQAPDLPAVVTVRGQSMVVHFPEGTPALPLVRRLVVDGHTFLLFVSNNMETDASVWVGQAEIHLHGIGSRDDKVFWGAMPLLQDYTGAVRVAFTHAERFYGSIDEIPLAEIAS